MDFLKDVMLVILGGIFVLLGVVLLKTAARQEDPALARRYQARGTFYFVLGAATVTLLLLRQF